MLETYFDDLQEDERCSPFTAWQRTLAVHRAWEWAYDSDLYGDDVPRPRRPDLPRVSPPRSTVAPTWAEMDLVIEAAAGSGQQDWRRKMFILMRYTGLRVSQVMRLLWSDLDLELGLLTVRPELGKTQQERAGRIVPICQAAHAEVAGWGRREGYVIPAPENTADEDGEETEAPKRRRTEQEIRKPDWGTSTKIIGRAAARLHPAPDGVTPEIERARSAFVARFPSPHHSFRHGFVTGLLVAGASERSVQILVGHAGGGVTRSTYTDAWQLMPELRRAVELIPVVGALRPGADLDAARRRIGVVGG